MKKTLIISIPMKYRIEWNRYQSDDLSLQSSDRKVEFPVAAFLERTLCPGDEIKAILIAKRGEFSYADRHIEELKREIDEINSGIGAVFEYAVIDSEFEEKRNVHEKLMRDLVAQTEDSTQIIADITYGSKDVPIVVFAAMNFAEKFLGCEVENILYGQAFFNERGEIAGAKLCDLSPLYTLNGLTGVIRCDTPEKARRVLDTMISL